ncbi:MAG: stimulus-sensing domain-containing protein [Bauldia sp.]
MTVGLERERLGTERLTAGDRQRASTTPLRFVWRIVTFGGFSSLTRRIIFLNLFALAALVTGILVLNQSRNSLIDARVSSLTTQGELIANAIAASASIDLTTNAPRLDPNQLLELEAGAPADLLRQTVPGLDFPIDPVQAQTVLNALATPNGPRVRIYDTAGVLLLDSDNLRFRRIEQYALPPPGAGPGFFERIWSAVTAWFRRSDLPIYRELGITQGRLYPEVASALAGQRDTITRVTERGELIVSVAVPIRYYQSVHGSLLLTSVPGEIDTIMREERAAILRVFAVAAAVSVVLSFFLAGTIAAPLRRLADAADTVRKGVRSRPQIPDFTRRRDEIGHLSQALRDMTSSLYNRIDAIERFAADVAHELKNPLTSLRSAVETLPLAKTPESHKRLTSIIQHDIKRLDRLITDIADASRLDAELTRREAESIDLSKLLQTLVNLVRETAPADGPKIVLAIQPGEKDQYVFMGHDTRMSQVFHNLVDNARSFTPPGSTITISAGRDGEDIEVKVEDQGPGIRPDQMDRIFERFYTDRPDQESFGQNSGLGLSISKQIVEAHQGRIWAENIVKDGADGTVTGARFVVRIPAIR